MRYGHFDDERREYVITRPDTPLPWINYLGSEAYFGLISNTAGGYSFYRDARLRRITRYRYNNVPLDSGGRYLYLRGDDHTEGDLAGEFWSPSWQPTNTTWSSTPVATGWGIRSSAPPTGGSKPRPGTLCRWARISRSGSSR